MPNERICKRGRKTEEQKKESDTKSKPEETKSKEHARRESTTKPSIISHPSTVGSQVNYKDVTKT